ncbi:MAG TPA: (2Fe-2S)-binding protein, partial [Dehalococcoidia bacterium]|nr:(2Fe-2S)-binding protein [Dehalococcoidia bacterium]
MEIRVNGDAHAVSDPRRNLLSYLRFDLGLTGTKYGCGEGLCGSCTVLVDGQVLRACLTSTGAVAGGDLRTIEGLASNPNADAPQLTDLHPVQAAFVEETALQCGYCTPGFVMAAVALLEREPDPSREQVREALSENMCRCGAYQRIEDAVMRAAEQMSGA